MQTLPVEVDFNYTLSKANINDIRPGDTIFHWGHVRTVNKSDIKRGGFCGTTITSQIADVGDSARCLVS